MTISAGLILLTLLARSLASVTSPSACDLSPEIRAELEKSGRPVAGSVDFDKNMAPLVALRQRHPQDLLVHESYQDAVQHFGIEGHLRRLTEEYQVLSMQHPEDLMYDFLYARSLIGRNTPAAVQQIKEILSTHPDFARAHAALAEIYASRAFQDAVSGEVERDRFSRLCPGSSLQQRPEPLPEPSVLMDQAERLLAGHGDLTRVVTMAHQSVRNDEWRLQRIRPFDWYSAAYKRANQRALQAEYWRMWSIEVRCELRAGHSETAAALLATMDQRVESLERHSDPGLWEAQVLLFRLYEEGNRRESAAQKLDSMGQFLARHPDPLRAAQLEQLRKLLAGHN